MPRCAAGATSGMGAVCGAAGAATCTTGGAAGAVPTGSVGASPSACADGAAAERLAGGRNGSTWPMLGARRPSGIGAVPPRNPSPGLPAPLPDDAGPVALLGAEHPSR